MPRLVVKTAHGPFEVKPQKDSAWICMCGLSKNQPRCDKSHKKTLDENEKELYIYDTVTGKRTSQNEEDGCCGGEGGCCGGGKCG